MAFETFSQIMSLRQEIVVTGVGVVSPIGIGKVPFWTSLVEGRSGIRRLDLHHDPTLSPPIGGAVADFDPKQYVRPRKSLKVMSRDIQLAFAAADLACVDADLREKPVAPERLGVVFGAGIIPCELDELMGAYCDCIVGGKFDYSRWGQAAMAELFPLWILKYLPNMPACHIGIGQDARGPNNSITLGDVSSLSALAEAARVLERGQADAVIAGGVGAKLHPAAWMRGLNGELSRRGDEPGAASRPFDAARDGLVNGEGSGALVLETRAHAQSRGEPPLARVLGHAVVFEPPGGKAAVGESIRRAILTALRDAEITPGEVGFVAAHGLSTVDDDRIEAQAIRSALGDVPVTAPKSYFGHLGPAAGALEAAMSVLALHAGLIPPTLNYERPDPQCPVNVVHGRPAPLERPTAMVLAHSHHGQAVAVVLGGAD
ncbi:MAG: beta-ketoacyl-[acyl-carrier-protein] synthase family protein [Planctomycetes bacterium]|nr:beta-ketoacyl-[acyl-carrier-protein] synthase family protein [Planctomycetota bacterium]MCG2683118.1 beta-ketoacyl-[acyl-carrier-protein] synthase family protein [Planctomycetales bacterium]